MEKPNGNVISIDRAGGQSHPERIERLRLWFLNQAASKDPIEATINFSITESGELHEQAVAVEPEHARILLPALERMMAALTRFAGIADESDNVVNFKHSRR